MLIPLRQAITDQIGQWFDKADCATGPGRMTEAEIKSMAVKTPAVRVACLGLPKAEAVGDGEVDRDVAFAAYILTTDKPKLPRDTAALAMVEDLLLRLPGQRWGKANVHAVAESAATAENLYSSKLGNTGVTLWAVVWTQKVRMGDNAYPNGPVLSAELYAGGEDAP
ncbi:MAG TPA: hypothetical protein VD978_33675 [Azospirillum sp.]|nr:hypothetical protein [Azospirillum sp.]